MKQSNWVFTTLVVGLLGCGGSEEPPGTIPGGNGATPATTGGGNTPTTGATGPTTGGGVTPPPPGGTTGGGVNGGTTTPGGDDGGGLCAEKMVSAQRIAPKMLIVLDKSGSMAPSGNDQMIDRWTGSVDALKVITADLEDSIKFGLMTYPAAGGGGGSSCGVGMVDVPIALMNAGPIANALSSMQPRGGTPTAGTLEVAKTLFDAPITVDDVQAPEYVLLVTDGSPNCYMGGAGNMPDPAAIQASVDLIAGMAMNDTKTYVIGYQTAQDPALSAALDQMAAAGGTGDTAHRPVEDSTTLITTFRDIAGKAVSCSLKLDEAPPDPSYVQVTLDGKQVNLNEADGWVLSADGLQITLQGASCKTLQSDGQHTVNVKVKCEIVNPM